MNIKPSVYKKLMAITKKGKKLVKIPNMVMRKLKWKEEQDRKLNSNSICIVCNFVFKYKTRGWSKNIKAICHPFDETKIFPTDRDLYLFSESDFCDNEWMGDIRVCEDRKKYEYDFFCFTIDSVQGIRCKGYHALPMISRVADELGMRGIVLDYYHVFPRPNYSKELKESSSGQAHIVREELKDCDNLVIKRGVKSQKEITRLMQKCKFVLFPNTRDASPRTIPETLLRGKPVLMNKNIWGGWKYINETNGLFFDSPSSLDDINDNEEYYYNEIKTSLLEMKDKEFNGDSIRRDYMSKYGFKRTSKRLASIINKIEGHKKYSYVAYEELSRFLTKL
ncbi:MAG: hypothetical protein ACTSSP_01425 [Candidatus Asgardarchaeia archaeon]